MENNLETPKQVYLKFLEIIANETGSPELLEYEETVVECMIEQVEHMEENISKLKDKLDSFCIEQHTSELDRLQYTINAYLRTRIQKIEQNSISLIKILKTDPQRAQKLMSAGEMKFLDKYFFSMENYLSETVLGQLDVPIRDASQTFSLLELPQKSKELLDNTYVFVKALKRTEIVVDSSDGDQETIALEPNRIHFLPYSSIRHFILNNKDNLVLM